MPPKNSTIRFFAWLQMLLSILLAGTVLYGYATYREPIGKVLESLSASLVSVSKVVGMTAETIASRNELIDSTKQTLLQTRAAIEQIRAAISDQTSQAPRRAEELRAASAVVARLGDNFDKLADGLINFSAPSGIEFEGLKPLVVMKRPLESYGANFKAAARDIKTTSDGILHSSKTVATDGVQLGAAFGQLSEQTLKLLVETEKTLSGIQQQDLPMAVQEMRSTSSQLQVASNEVGSIRGAATVLLVIGLLLSIWCFVNSVSLLALASRSVGEHKLQMR